MTDPNFGDTKSAGISLNVVILERRILNCYTENNNGVPQNQIRFRRLKIGPTKFLPETDNPSR